MVGFRLPAHRPYQGAGMGWGNYWSPYALDRARKYILSGDRKWLTKGGKNYPVDPATQLIDRVGRERFKKMAVEWRNEGRPYFSEKSLNEVYKSNAGEKVKVKQPVEREPIEISPEAQAILDKYK